MSELEDRIREALADPRHELPVWQDPMRRVRRAARRQTTRLALTTALPAVAAISVAIPVVTSLLGPAAGAHHVRTTTAYVGFSDSVNGRHFRPGPYGIVPISLRTNTPGRPIANLSGPIAISPDGKTAYTVETRACTPRPRPGRQMVRPGSHGRPGSHAHGLVPAGPTCVAPAGAMIPFSTATNTPGKPIEVGPFPDAIAITPNGKTVYVANLLSDSVTPINAATRTAGPPIKVGIRPRMIAVTPDGRTAYVVNQGDMRGTVTPINTATNRAGPPIKVGPGPTAIAITPDGRTAYVANNGVVNGWTVTPIDTATNTPGRPIHTGIDPDWIAITPNGKTAYVGSLEGPTVTPINIATNTPGKQIHAGQSPVMIAITPNGKTAYVVNDLGIRSPGTVTPINTATNTPGRPITVGKQPWNIAITPDGRTVYVVSTSSGTVTPINTATNTAGTPILVGKNANFIAIGPTLSATSP